MSARTTGPMIRPATAEDGPALTLIDIATWSPRISPGPPCREDADFFGPRVAVADVLVAEADGRVAGWIRLTQVFPLESAARTQEIGGLAVDPAMQGRGIGRALVEGARELALARKARKLTLRVLGTNDHAMALYQSAGYEPEGVLKGLFFLDGQYVDDVLMSLDLR
ncbi:GNAT family N-acetyltransferase [Nocardiopsis ansamitocini]|uniref:N-acetyltransferase n=1 Tax=Nocardiopsis ansamitocini TaxID=1670832 RepID=A0A9W6UJV4_9ACTN|nr:GNAT family N-acetyltransferase [Nocardiopsis ansamitocini]GLU49249.1 N-acetyltransferase [Nocardiopsis ansamitocini]